MEGLSSFDPPRAPPPAAPQPNVTYVSMMVYNQDDPNPPIQRIKWLLTLMDAKLPIVLYVCSFYHRLIGNYRVPNATIIPFHLEETEIMRHIRSKEQALAPIPLELPEYRNQLKDTVFFCGLMGVKTELVARAVRDGLIRTPFVAFLDASIAKVLAQPTRALAELRDLSVSSTLTVPLIPGCRVPAAPWPSREELAGRICWMFCGGFFLLPAGKAMEWHVRCREGLLEFLREGRVTWEVNVWAAMVSETPGLVAWFLADHNEKMLRVPDTWKN
jgi:hypothetical protein